MTVNHLPDCTDYDPDYKLHGCELGEHAADKPHRNFLGVEWTESLQLPCPSISNEGRPCALHFGHFPARHRPAGAEVWSEDEWTDTIYRASGPRKAAPAGGGALGPAATHDTQLDELTAGSAVRDRACPLCETPAGEPCQPKPAGDHLARYLDAYTAGQLTKAYMAMALGELVVVDACSIVTEVAK